MIAPTRPSTATFSIGFNCTNILKTKSPRYMTTDAKIIFDMAGRIDTSLMNILEKFN